MGFGLLLSAVKAHSDLLSLCSLSGRTFKSETVSLMVPGLTGHFSADGNVQ